MSAPEEWVALLESDGQPIPAGSDRSAAGGDRNAAWPPEIWALRRRTAALRARAWWQAARRPTRLVAVLAALGVVCACCESAAAALARHRDVAVVRTVPAAPPVSVDAAGCPLAASCAVRTATNAVRTVQSTAVRQAARRVSSDPYTAHFANLPFTDAIGTEVYDAAHPDVVYARSVRASGTSEGAEIAVQIDVRCTTGRTPTPTRSSNSAALGAPVAADTAVRTYPNGATSTRGAPTRANLGGTCSIRVSCRYPGLFTAGGYPYDSPVIGALVAGLADSPRVRL